MTVTFAQFEGAFKRRYGKLEEAIPSFGILQRRWKFESAAMLGDEYAFPVLLRRSHGVTFAGASASQPVALNPAVSLLTKQALVKGTEFVLQEDLAYGAVSRAREQGEAAFFSSLDQTVIGMKESASFYLEACLLYGQDSIGSVPDNGPAAVEWDVVIPDADWAPGLWIQMEGAYVDLWSSDFATQRNTGANQRVKVLSVDTDTKTVTLGAWNDATDTASATNFADFASAPLATDVIVFKGAKAGSNWNQFAGIKKIATNTGLLFNINAAEYSLWKANNKAMTGRATMGKVHQLVTAAVVKGLTGMVSVYTPTYSWVDMMNDTSALRRYAEDTRQEMQLGTNKLVFHGVNGSSMEIVQHPMIKTGEIYVVQDDRVKRIGSTDTTFKLPGSPDKFVMNLEGYAAYRIRNYWDQGLIHLRPSTLVRGHGFVSDSD